MSIALVTMPWSTTRFPSIQLGTLKGTLKIFADKESDVHYLNLRLARELGVEKYNFLADSRLPLLGEWLFSHLAADDPSTLPEDYLDFAVRKIKEDYDDPDPVIKQVSDIDVESLRNEILPRYLDSCIEEIDWARYGMVGFSSMFEQNTASLALARRLKEDYPQIKIIFGGANCDGEMGQTILQLFSCVDYVISGEGDRALPELVKAIDRGEGHPEIGGVWFRRNGQVDSTGPPELIRDLDQTPPPDYTDYYLSLSQFPEVQSLDPSLLIESARGCWWGEKAHCTFCGLNADSMEFRAKSQDRMLEEILELSRRYKVLKFCAVDNIISMKYFSEFLPKLAESGVDLHIYYETKANLKREQIKLLAAAGVREIQPGLESLSTGVLTLMKKGVSAIQNIQTLKWCREEGIGCDWAILSGFPGETAEQYRDMVELAGAITHLQPPQGVNRIWLERFSPYFRFASEYGIEDIRPAEAYRYVYGLSEKERGGLAYFFDYQAPSVEGFEEYVTPLREQVRAWKDDFFVDGARLLYRRGPGFMVISDYRRRREFRPRKHTLDALGTEIYLHCDQIRSRKGIDALVQESLGESYLNRVPDLLDKLVRDRLMVREGMKYLSLAMPEV